MCFSLFKLTFERLADSIQKPFVFSFSMFNLHISLTIMLQLGLKSGLSTAISIGKCFFFFFFFFFFLVGGGANILLLHIAS